MMKVAARRSTRARSKRTSTCPNSSLIHHEVPKENQDATSSHQYTKALRKGKVDDISNHKITEFFHVRRSSRKTSKQIEAEEKDALREAIESGSNEADLIVYKDPLKGRGIKAGRDFLKGELVVEYKGTMMEYSQAKRVEEKYAQDASIGSYMYFFTWNNKKWCIDATAESKYKGRLINHSYLRPNLRTKVVEFDGLHHLILVAKRDIEEGEELMYDYGDRTADTIAKNPWLVNT